MHMDPQNTTTPEPGPDRCDGPADTTGQVMAALRRIIHVVESHSHALAQEYKLTLSQLAVLQYLTTHDGATVGQLSRAVHLSQATVTGIVDRLQARGLLRRQRSVLDRRRVQLMTTPEGLELLQRRPPIIHEAFSRQLSSLPVWQQHQILSSLEHVAEMMELPTPSAGPRPDGRP